MGSNKKDQFTFFGAKRDLLKTAFILNTKNGDHRRWSNLLEREFPGDFELWSTKEKGDSRKLARQAVKEGFTNIIVVGGDGSLNECANGMMDFKQANPNTVLPEIGIIPNGTGNDFVRSVDRISNLETLYDRMMANESSALDLGILKTASKQEYFVNIADAGIGSHVIDKMARSSKRMGSSLTFASAIVKSFFTYKKQVLQCTGDSFQFSGPALAIVAANGKYFGGGLGIAPEAMVNDGLLDIIIIGDVSLFDYMRQLPKLKKARKISHPDVKYYRTSHLRIEGIGTVEKDGEPGSELPVEIGVERGALRLIN